MTRVNYDLHGGTYARHRHADPRIAARIHAALGHARTVLNVRAGSPPPWSRARGTPSTATCASRSGSTGRCAS